MPSPHLCRPIVILGSISAAIAAISVVAIAQAEPNSQRQDQADTHRVPLAVARDRAKTMHDIYAATLESMHQFYFHGERAAVPAKVLEDVFADLRHQTKMEARWISVTLKPMSITHEPKSEFEKRAAKEIAEGKAEFDAIEGGFYRRAGVIPLSGGCVSCHGGLFKGAEGRPHFAGLVISIPIVGGPEKGK